MNKNLDLYIVYQFLKKLTTPFEEWKAYDLGIIDKKGKVLIPRDKLTKEQVPYWTYFETYICYPSR